MKTAQTNQYIYIGAYRHIRIYIYLHCISQALLFPRREMLKNENMKNDVLINALKMVVQKTINIGNHIYTRKLLQQTNKQE